MNIVIEPIELDSVLYYGKEKYNSNNHWVLNQKPENYDTELKKCETSLWIDKFHQNYSVINIFSKDISWMKEAYSIGTITQKFPSQYEDEKEDLVKRYNIENIFENKEYFVRSDSVSLKNGIHGVGPYKSFDKIIESICTCRQGHSPIDKETKSIKLFLLPWLKFEYMNEYRIFVFQNRITCISQQHLYERNYLFADLEDSEREILIKKYISIIVKYFEEKIKKDIIHMQNYSYDFIIKDDDKPYLVEFNSFGKEKAAGSALFHWIIDENKLYNENNLIYFRYTY